MDNEKNKSNEMEKTEELKNNSNDDLQRITVSKEAQIALGELVDQVNEGFKGGKVNRTQMANWILLKFKNELNDERIQEVRSEHFDEVAMLESILKEAKATGRVPTDFEALIQKQLGFGESSKRKTKAALT